MARSLGPLLAVLLAALVVAPSALADESLQVGTNPSPIAGGDNFQFTASGASASGNPRLDVFSQPANDPCASTVAADDGHLWVDYAGLDNSGPNGSFSYTANSFYANLTFGSYNFCGYLLDGTGPDPNHDPPLATDFHVVNVANGDTLRVYAPHDPGFEGQQNAVWASGYVDQPAEIDITYKPAGGSCAAKAAADQGTKVGGDALNTGNIDYSTDTIVFPAGSFLVCGWLEPPGNPSGTPFATSSFTLRVQGLDASVRFDVPSQVAWGSAATAGVDYRTNIPSDLSMRAYFPAPSACPQDARSGPVQGSLNPLFDPATGLPDLPIPQNKLSGHVDVDVSPPNAGRVLLCAWIDAQQAHAGPFSASFTQLKPGQFPAPDPKHGKVYRGKTKQRLPIAFAAGSSRVSDLSFKAKFKCSNKARIVQLTQMPPAKLKGKKFKAVLKNRVDHATVQGRVSGNTAKGTLTEIYTSQGGSKCSSGKVRFSAKAR
jgi:hypothetical protein